MVRFDRDRWPAGERHAFDDVGIERALRQELGAADFFGFGLEHLDEIFADNLALSFRIGDAGQRGEELLGGIDVHKGDIVVVAK